MAKMIVNMLNHFGLLWSHDGYCLIDNFLLALCGLTQLETAFTSNYLFAYLLEAHMWVFSFFKKP